MAALSIWTRFLINSATLKLAFAGWGIPNLRGCTDPHYSTQEL